MVKLEEIQRLLRCYYRSEDPGDVFEGFVRLISYMDLMTTNLARHYDLSLVKEALFVYHDFIQANPTLAEKPIQLKDENIVVSFNYLIR